MVTDRPYFILLFLLIYNNFELKTVEISIYVSLVRPHLEYAVQAWNPNLQGEIDKIERVKRTTRIPFGFEKLVYEERLKRLCLTCLKDRRLRGD